MSKKVHTPPKAIAAVLLALAVTALPARAQGAGFDGASADLGRRLDEAMHAWPW